MECHDDFTADFGLGELVDPVETVAEYRGIETSVASDNGIVGSHAAKFRTFDGMLPVVGEA